VHSHELTVEPPVFETASVKIADTTLRRWCKVVALESGQGSEE
jgi:hypothetical protein